ncbi:hypothetical protein [Nitriliruptor alkaliphilus]|uniref:hypothetical protein n=1 Tax=Nitriliruptor alkaliphilus TaxID=427918 RepID=UPI001B80C796|nr:hypothetical protein [Nitriliruptor alkaliphilus]
MTVFHLTPVRNLPLIEEDGLRTRADLSGRLGPVDDFDQAAPGTYANGKRVTGWLSRDHAGSVSGELGPGLVSYSVDPRKTLAAPASLRDGDPAAYWEAAKPLADWQAEGEPPTDLEVHTNVPVRAKYLQLHAPLVDEEDLGDYAPLVAAVADEDRLSAKALMHLAVIASEADFESTDFVAACALAWRDEQDSPNLVRELIETDPDKVASAALAEHGATAPEVTGKLRQILDETREWADSQGLEHGRGLFARTAAVLDVLED